jgi:hypothetical protein
MCRLFVSGIVTVVVLSAGCHRPTDDSATTVHGVVTFQGRPLAGGSIAFTPDGDRGGNGKPIAVELAGDGTYLLKQGNETSISPGWYRIAIAPHASSSTAGPALFPRELARPDRSGLLREVKAGQDNRFDFVVELDAQK